MPQIQGIRFIENVLHTIWRVVLSILFSAPVAGIVAALAVEIVGFLTTRQFPGSITTHILALMFMLVTGYAVALTYAVVEVLMGATRVAVHLERDLTHDFAKDGKILESAIRH